jgi:hypothetical protein
LTRLRQILKRIKNQLIRKMKKWSMNNSQALVLLTHSHSSQNQQASKPKSTYSWCQAQIKQMELLLLMYCRFSELHSMSIKYRHNFNISLQN